MKHKIWINWIVMLGLVVATFGLMPASQPAAQAATVIRVKPGGSASLPCGDNWANACELQTALTNVSIGDEIWVATGTYKPGTNRGASFQLVGGVALYGGFAGVETTLEQRDWKANPTVLSGDIGVEGDNSDNSYNVVTGSELWPVAIMDGFIITGGNAGFGGGGMAIGNYSTLTLTNIVFIGNNAKYGGGMYNNSSGPTLTNVIFSGNTATVDGGGMYNTYFDPTLTNVTFSNNSAGGKGGGMYNFAGVNPNITNTILWGNTAAVSGPQIYNYELNGTLYSTPHIQYSDVQGGCESIPGNDCSGGGNINADPLFVRDPTTGADGLWGTDDDDYGDLRLRNGSPAIDAGDNTAPGLAGIITDLDGNPRFYDVPEKVDTGVGPAPVVDMGACERQVNDSPVGKDDDYSTFEGFLLHKGAPGILANDNEPDGDTLTSVLESGPSSGSLTLNQDGSFDYLPEKGYTGAVSFTYRATDGLLDSNTAKVTIIIIEAMKVYMPITAR